MKIRIIAVGKIKDKYLSLGIQDYLTRITPYSKIDIVEVKDELAHDTGNFEINRVKEIEGKNILKLIKMNDYVITLDLNKHFPNSEEFAKLLSDKMQESGANLTFVIGGSYGLSEEVRNRSNYGLSLSNLTFLHTMTRLILLEQIYRAFKILSNEVYHK